MATGRITADGTCGFPVIGRASLAADMRGCIRAGNGGPEAISTLKDSGADATGPNFLEGQQPCSQRTLIHAEEDGAQGKAAKGQLRADTDNRAGRS